MAIGIPYADAINLPLHIAMAFLGATRPLPRQVESTPSETPQAPPKSSVTTHTKTNGNSSTVTKTYVTSVRKHSKSKG
ncbi:hypothetical protein [Acinetobacter baumannii]|uniref:hypothetical protein n=1 Tax=Acinetobacter baumannii TaxID=470 RepID=UPI0009896C8D|nr:hypothetical protein [Acinetobacter baumannii]OOD22889.1 hypothetical protein BWP00_05555 [Acinetobacter baumannii]